MPLISIIIPTYNAEPYIINTLESVFAQTFQDFEVIIIDDFSSDNTIKVIKDSFDNIKLLKNDKNRGASYSRNKGINNALGEYIAFLDADDLWFPDKLSSQINAMKKYNLKFCYGLAKSIPTSSISINKILSSNVPISDEDIKIKLLKDIFIFPYFSTSTIVIDKALCLQIGGFREDLKTAEDIDFCLKAAEKTDVLAIELFVSITRKVEGSLGTSPDSYQDNINVIDDFLRRNERFEPEHKTVVLDVKTKVYNDYVIYLIHKRDLKKALDVLITSLSICKLNFNYIKSLIKIIILTMLKPLKIKNRL